MCIAEIFHLCEWKTSVKVYLESFIVSDKALEVTQKFMDDCETRVSKREVEVDIPEGEGLTGSKILGKKAKKKSKNKFYTDFSRKRLDKSKI